MKDKDFLNFKKLLEYFISHLEWIVNNDSSFIGYQKYIEPFLKANKFKITGQGYNGGKIQKQIFEWDHFEGNQVCINVTFNQRIGYQSKFCYLNWIWTGINIIAEWEDNHIVGLYQELFIEKQKPQKSIWKNLNMSKSVEELGLFDESDKINENLKSFYENFRSELIKHQYRENHKKYMEKIEKKIKLLEYKKQIILQGPPGTGKTRLAKEIAKEMIPLTSEFIKNKITVGNIIPTAKGQVSYKVLSVTEEKIVLEREKGTTNDTTTSRIIAAFEEQKWNNEIKNNDDRMAVALAKYLFDDFFADNEQFKLIQFHPSYTYEDFVRGIVAKPDEEENGLIYDAENKLLAKFAKEALINFYRSSDKTNNGSIDIWIDKSFEDFKNDLDGNLNDEGYVLSEKVNIFKVRNKDFLYGKDWKTPGHLKFEEFKNLIKAVINQEIDLASPKLDKDRFVHSHYRFTYYGSLLKKFFEKYSYKEERENVDLKNYVLVIDEINRANLSSVLGELIYALEYRGEEVESMYEVDGSQKLILPPNLYIIGTMNTADRSVGHIDYAIRRRFAFVEVLPKDLSSEMGDGEFYTDLFSAVKALFTKDDYQTKSDFLSQEFEPKDVTLGHSYFIDKTKDGGDIKTRWNYEIKPILLEYIRDGVLKETASEQVISIETKFDLKIK